MTTPYKPNLITRLYYAYKSINLPFRRKIFKGFDLDGNKFYESYNPLTPNKWRRTVQYVHDGHYTDNNVTPQWMSWLRYTRPNPPTMDELRGEVARIQATRSNAQLISQRWNQEKLRLESVGGPQLQATQPTTQQQETSGRQGRDGTGDNDGEYLPAPGTRDEKGEWQPEAWNPASGKAPICR